MHRRRTTLVGLLVALLMLAGCGSATPPTAPDPAATGATPLPQPTGPQPTEPGTTEPGTTGPGTEPTETVVAQGLRAPWAIGFLPDGTALVTVRDTAEVLRVGLGREPVSLGVVPGVAHGGEGGLLGLAVAPGSDQDFFVYFTTRADNRVQRMHLDGDALVPGDVVLDGVPRAGNHNGGRIAFGPDGYLYVATGDAAVPRLAQDVGSPAGKILRVTPDGEPAPGNPAPGSPVWSWGHRNVQGLAWDEDGRLFASEFGQNAWDELNLIEAGGNYGWPVVEGTGRDGRFVDPLVVWTPAEASPSGIAVLGDAVYVAALRGESLWRVPTSGEGAPERLLAGVYGRLRAVEVDPDGRVWLLTSNTSRGRVQPGDDRVIVLAPGVVEGLSGAGST